MAVIGRPAPPSKLSSSDIADNAIGTAHIQANVITHADLAPNSVTSSEMADDAVGIAELSASGTPNATSFLRGDNSWQVVDTEGTGIKSTGESGGNKFLREDGDGTSSWQTAGSPSITDNGNATALTIGADEGLTINGSLQQLTNRNLSGTYSSHELFIADGFTLTGNITVNEDIVLTKLSDDGNTLTLTTDGTSRTITGTGSIEASTIAQTPVTSVTGMTGVLNSAVTGELNSAITGSPAIHLNNTVGTIPSAVTGGTGLTPTIDFAWASSPLSRSGNYTTFYNYTSVGSSISAGPDRFTINTAGYYYAEAQQRVSGDSSYSEMFKNNTATYATSWSGAIMGAHDHSRGGANEYAHANFMGILAVGDHISMRCITGTYGSGHQEGYNGQMWIWRLR